MEEVGKRLEEEEVEKVPLRKQLRLLLQLQQRKPQRRSPLAAAPRRRQRSEGRPTSRRRRRKKKEEEEVEKAQPSWSSSSSPPSPLMMPSKLRRRHRFPRLPMKEPREQKARARLPACAVGSSWKTDAQGRGCAVASMRRRKQRRLSKTNSTSKLPFQTPLSLSARWPLRCLRGKQGGALTTS